MNQNDLHKGSWKISELITHTPDAQLAQITPQGDETSTPSADRIKRLALEKRREYINEEEKPMKRASFRVALIAAMVCLISVSAFAAFGGLDYIKGIFGESAQTIENEIVTPQVAASAGGRDMALEALVTDGFVTNMVISLTGALPPEEALFSISSDTALRSVSWHVLDTFTTPGKTYYVVDMFSETRFDTADATLALHPDIAPISLSFTIENALGNAVVDFPDSAMSGQVQLAKLQVSPMGFLLIGHEGAAEGGLPATDIQLVFADGHSERLDIEFAPSDETVGGGGGAIIGGGEEAVPLVTAFQGTRNPDGELVINGQFSRVIDPDKIEKIVVEGIEYPVE